VHCDFADLHSNQENCQTILSAATLKAFQAQHSNNSNYFPLDFSSKKHKNSTMTKKCQLKKSSMLNLRALFSFLFIN